MLGTRGGDHHRLGLPAPTGPSVIEGGLGHARHWLKSLAPRAAPSSIVRLPPLCCRGWCWQCSSLAGVAHPLNHAIIGRGSARPARPFVLPLGAMTGLIVAAEKCSSVLPLGVELSCTIPDQGPHPCHHSRCPNLSSVSLVSHSLLSPCASLLTGEAQLGDKKMEDVFARCTR